MDEHGLIGLTSYDGRVDRAAVEPHDLPVILCDEVYRLFHQAGEGEKVSAPVVCDRHVADAERRAPLKIR